MPELRVLLEAVGAWESSGDDDLSVTGVTQDSRQVRPGDLYVAIRGLQQDGHEFVEEAIGRGAVAVLVEDPGRRPRAVPSAVVPNGRRALALAAAALHGFPGRKLRLIGVTGTDGKTTTTHLTAAVLAAAGHRVGMISTVAVCVDGVTWQNSTSHTTPQAPELQALLAKMAATGVDYAVVEVSSHALALDRVAGCDFDVAVFTNLTTEHMNFHGSFEEYRRQKGRLFELLGEGRDKGAPRAGVVNADDPSAGYLADACPAPVISYGFGAADLVARDVALTAQGTSLYVAGPFGEMELQTSLVGRFNVYNWLAAIGAGLSQGATPLDVARAAAGTPPVPGRLQRVDLGQPFAVVVDFAHTPNALAQALEAVRPYTTGRLIVVFGHAGGRDAANRPRMGEVAARHADLTILTTDDPYDEAPEAIVEAIALGLERSGRRLGVDYLKVVDRREAISLAVRLAGPGDTVLLAGRGHEQHTTVRGVTVHLDDVEEAMRALRQRTKGAA